MCDRFIGIDASFTRTGIAEISNGIVKTHSCSNPIGEKTFKNVFLAANSLAEEILKSLGDLSGAFIVLEEPFPGGTFSSGLYCLDSLILEKVLGRAEVALVHPTWLGYIHEKRKHSGTDSVNLTKELMVMLKTIGYKVPEKRISHDEAEAFLFSVLGMLRHKPKLGEHVIIERYPRFGVDKLRLFGGQDGSQ